MTENNEYTQTNLERVEYEANERAEAVNALRGTHSAWYGQNFEDWSTEQIKTVNRIFRKVSEPLADSRAVVNDWLEENKEDYTFSQQLTELFENLEEPLGIEVTIRESIDVKIEATVKAYRKAWEKKEAFVESIVDNLSVELTIRHSDLEIDDYDIDTVEEA